MEVLARMSELPNPLVVSAIESKRVLSLVYEGRAADFEPYTYGQMATGPIFLFGSQRTRPVSRLARSVASQGAEHTGDGADLRGSPYGLRQVPCTCGDYLRAGPGASRPHTCDAPQDRYSRPLPKPKRNRHAPRQGRG